MLPQYQDRARAFLKSLTASFIVLVGVNATLVNAGEPVVLFEDSFDGDPGTTPAIPPWTNVNSAAHENHEAELRLDTENRFGKGAANRFLEFQDASDGTGSLRVSGIDLFSEEVVTLSFLFYEPDDPDYNHQFTVQLFAGNGERINANRAQVLRLRNGVIPMNDGPDIPYGHHTTRRVDFIVNNSSSSVSYEDGATLASGLADVWLDGEQVAAGYSFARQSDTGPIRSIDFSTFSNHNQRIFIDDVAVYRGAVVNPAPDLAPSEPQEVDFPLQLDPGKSASELFGYNPEYTQNIPTFDSHNRPYIRNRGVYIGPTSFVHTWDESGWEERDFLQAIRNAYSDFHSIHQGAGRFAERVVFDSEDRAYSIVNIRLNGGGHRNLLLFSTDYGKSWEVHELSRGGVFALEHFVGHNEIDGPPFLLLSRRSVDPRPEDRWASAHAFYFIQPRIENDQLIVPPYTENHINDRLLSLGQHTGGSSFSVSKDGKTHFVWIEVTNDDVSGTPTFAATYDHATETLHDPVLIAYAPPVNNSHNRPGIVMDSNGYLHVVTGSHHGQNFYYTRSLEPHDVYAGWTEPEAVWPSGWRAVNGEDRGGQTYVALVCDPDDTLHLVFRHWRDLDEYFNRSGFSYYAGLSYQRRPVNGEWSEPRLLVAPERGQYGNYYHKLGIDRIGRLFLSISYFDWELDEQTTADEAYWHRMVLLSDDAGDTWRLAENADFDNTWRLTPYNEWRFRHFTPAQIRAGEFTGDDHAPAGDDIPNLLKFLLDLPAWTAAPQDLPVPFVDDGHLAIDFSVPEEVGEIDHWVEVSEDLAQWHDDSGEVEIIEQFRADGRIHLRARVVDPSASATSKFLRLRATRAPSDTADAAN